jgi:hypothetical protein
MAAAISDARARWWWLRHSCGQGRGRCGSGVRTRCSRELPRGGGGRGEACGHSCPGLGLAMTMVQEIFSGMEIGDRGLRGDKMGNLILCAGPVPGSPEPVHDTFFIFLLLLLTFFAFDYLI